MEPTFDEHIADDDPGADENCVQCGAPGVTTMLHQDSFRYGLGEDATTL